MFHEYVMQIYFCYYNSFPLYNNSINDREIVQQYEQEQEKLYYKLLIYIM